MRISDACWLQSCLKELQTSSSASQVLKAKYVRDMGKNSEINVK